VRARLLIATLLVAAPCAASAQGDPADERVLDPPASPTRVGIGVHLTSLNSVDSAAEIFPHFSASMLLTLRWRDPRLAFTDERETRRVFQGQRAVAQLRAMWHPDIVFENEDGERHVDGRTLAIRRDGTVIYEEVLSATFRARVRLHRFPFDDQRFHIAAQSVTWNLNKVTLEVIRDKTGLRAGNQRGSLEWHVSRLEHRVLEVPSPQSGHRHARAVFFIAAQRSSGFYLWKLILPLMLIVCFTWSTFWMTGEAAPTRLQRAFIALLSIVAYQRVVADHLPRIPYLTFMDAMVYLAFAFTGATVVQVVTTHRFLSTDRAARAAALDRVCRWLFPLTFVLGIAALAVYYRFLS
jgi:hypothetical protein